MRFADALRNRRTNLGLSLDVVASELTFMGFPTTANQVQLWERGRNIPPLEHEGFRVALARVLQVKADALAKFAIASNSALPDDVQQLVDVYERLAPERRALALRLLRALLDDK
jgi:transcriptional regulator with XRE-family HTH domain